MPRCRWPDTANHPHLFERSLLACSLTACMCHRWMYEETWEPCLQIRFMSRVLISSIRTVLDWWWQIMFCACPLLRRRSKRHFNWRDTKALVYHDSAYVRSCSLFFMCSTIATLTIAHHGDALVIELTWELGSALSESVVDMCVGCVRRTLGFVKLFSHIIGLNYLCAPSILYRRECCTPFKCLYRLPSVFLMSLGLLTWCLLLGICQQACVPCTLKSSFVAAWIVVACWISLEAERRRITLFWADAAWEPLCLQAKCERLTICSSFHGRGPGNPALAEAMHM